jgi:hypothetical protein
MWQVVCVWLAETDVAKCVIVASGKAEVVSLLSMLTQNLATASAVPSVVVLSTT